ncbi:MAG: twin-arginine translocase TatA/TatE family subunit [Acidaminococcaceae bacterium]
MLNIGTTELILILIIALVVFGPGKIPEVGKALGKGLQEFRTATSLETKKEETSEAASDVKTQKK